MTFPVVAARTTTAEAVGTTSHSIGLGSPSAGELIIAFVATANPAGLFFIDESVSGNAWRMTQTAGAILGGRMALLVKVASGSDALTLLTSSSVRAVATCYRVSGHGSTVAGGTFATGATSNGNPPSASITGAAQDILFLTAMATNSVTASAAPTNYGTLTTASAASVFIASAERTLNGTSDDPGTFTNGFDEWISTTVAIPELAITTALRQSQESVEIASDATPTARVTQVAVESLSNVTVAARISLVAVEMVSTNVPDGLVTASPSMLFIAT